jgi:transposase InsO family protein
VRGLPRVWLTSDLRGSLLTDQFRSRKFVHAVVHNGLQGSTGRVGACGDNAAMESSSRCCNATS